MVKGFLSTFSFSLEKKSVPPEAGEDRTLQQCRLCKVKIKFTPMPCPYETTYRLLNIIGIHYVQWMIHSKMLN